ncbi:hypothetical protein WJX84_002519 [Apatococcus fuscideae]|uniref:RRM domain-containing protein n=1 Tax=Apatococcus fuscideae TaxID=2026836 RepID=A0AAW1SXH9_9CHLO
MATIRPNKVLHIRNLPYETTEEELKELCQPFGKLVQTKLNVGANKNQAFVEFTDMNAAIQMVSYYASSADPAKVRGKTVYLQYSTRQEIVNSKTQGDTPSNVLLVTLEALMPDIVITIDTLHLVFSAFGFVCKIATFEKSAGFQALIQYADRDTAEQVRHHLDGRHIPRQLLNDTPNPPMLKISFSQHTDLNVKFQSHRSRDYTNPYLPVAPSAGDPNLATMGMSGGSGGGGNPSDGNVLLCSIENQMYPVTVDPLHTVFSPYGAVQKIAIFEKNNGWQALIQYADPVSAANAKTALEGHAIYDGGYNRLKIAYSVHRDLNVKGNNERSRDYTLPEPGTSYAGAAMQPGSAYAGNGFMGGADGAPATNGTNLNITGAEYEQAHESISRAAQAVANGQPNPLNAPSLMGQGPSMGQGPPMGMSSMQQMGGPMGGPPGMGGPIGGPLQMGGPPRPPMRPPGGPPPMANGPYSSFPGGPPLGPRGMPPQGGFPGGPPSHYQQGPPHPGGMFQGGPPQHGPGPNSFGGPPPGHPSWGPPRF